MAANVTMLPPSPITFGDQTRQAPPLIGAVLVQGAGAPRLIRREDLKSMKDGAVIVDVAVDQGGCIETCKPTTHADPTYVVDGVLHYCVANMPGAVPRTSTFGLTNATGPWAKKLAGMGAAKAAHDPVLSTAANVLAGVCTHEAVAQAFDLPFESPDKVL
jgi:alanine dehydrogenase